MSGTLYGIGTAGYSWAATITDADAYRLDFYHLGIIPHSSYYRANGFPLRCLQEEVRPKGCSAGLADEKALAEKTPAKRPVGVPSGTGPTPAGERHPSC